MTETLHFELLSPVKKLIGKQVAMVTVPGVDGDFGVMPGHAMMIAGVRPGVVSVHEGDAVTDRIFVSGGHAEVVGERCIVLTHEAVPVAELSRPDLENEIGALNRELAQLDDEEVKAREALTGKLSLAQARLDVVLGHQGQV